MDADQLARCAECEASAGTKRLCQPLHDLMDEIIATPQDQRRKDYGSLAGVLRLYMILINVAVADDAVEAWGMIQRTFAALSVEFGHEAGKNCAAPALHVTRNDKSATRH